ncbi:hypothetical protein [Streptomyces sp. NPDC048392]|uniref:hypothetical protein n=1 Tax=Streptomyces sp. NPDC048392 TaxID=3365543 RepID=UPI003720E8EB
MTPAASFQESEDSHFDFLRGRLEHLQATVDAREKQPLTGAQIAQITAAVAASPALAESLADTIAARLKD